MSRATKSRQRVHTGSGKAAASTGLIGNGKVHYSNGCAGQSQPPSKQGKKIHNSLYEFVAEEVDG